MTKRELAAVKKSFAKIEKIKTQMAKLRDTLRDEISDLEGILESLNDGVNLTEDGLRSLNEGLDEMSKYV